MSDPTVGKKHIWSPESKSVAKRIAFQKPAVERVKITGVPVLKVDEGRNVLPNGRLERRIVADLIAHLDVAGFVPAVVWDGEVEEPCSDAKSAMEFIFNLDEASVRFFRRGHLDAGWHGVLLVLGNGIDIISDWNYLTNDTDGFNAAMESFDPEGVA
jgi:hypothetical protein